MSDTAIGRCGERLVEQDEFGRETQGARDLRTPTPRAAGGRRVGGAWARRRQVSSASSSRKPRAPEAPSRPSFA